MPETPVSAEGALSAQILLKLGELSAAIQVMNEKLSKLPDHEERIRQLERFRYLLTGAVLLGSGAAGVLGAFIEHVLVHG